MLHQMAYLHDRKLTCALGVWEIVLLVYGRTQKLGQSSPKDRAGEILNGLWNESGSQTAEIPKPLGFWDPKTPRLLVQNVLKPLGFRSM